MPYETLPGGLELVLPTNSTQNWGTILKNSTWTKINNHQHTGAPDGEKLTGASLADNSIGKDQLSKNVALTQQSLVTAGITQSIDWADGNKVNLDLSAATGDVTVSLLNPIEGASYRIKLVQGATKRTLLWPADVKWPQGEEPTQFSEANWVDIVYLDFDGTDYICKWDLNLG